LIRIGSRVEVGAFDSSFNGAWGVPNILVSSANALRIDHADEVRSLEVGRREPMTHFRRYGNAQS
jgi:hypothetical protein